VSGGLKTESDGTLVTAVLCGDRSAFAEIVRRYQKSLSRVAVGRLGRREWAEDVVQETFLSAFRSLHTYDSRFSFRTWLWTILLNQCRRQAKKRARLPLVSSWTDNPYATDSTATGVQIESGGGCPSAHLLDKELRGLLNRLLNRLPTVQADAVRLRFYGEMKFHEIADAMQCSLSTAKNRVRWGLMKLSKLSEGEGMVERTADQGHASFSTSVSPDEQGHVDR
jgi:RNA polymerase sigma-70 factor, ECF subfamily